jgi:hypothetical protein
MLDTEILSYFRGAAVPAPIAGRTPSKRCVNVSQADLDLKSTIQLTEKREVSAAYGVCTGTTCNHHKMVDALSRCHHVSDLYETFS